MRTASLLRVFASACAVTLPLTATDCTLSSSSCDGFVDHPTTVALDSEAGSGDSGADAGLDCFAICHQVGQCSLNPGGKTVTCHQSCTGRRPKGLVASNLEIGTTPGAYFALMAGLEAASIDAFRILGDELAALRAPARLVRAADRAKRDEKRHARAAAAMARRFGAVSHRPVVSQWRTRRPVDVAVENAVEGCVRETFGALVAYWQADHAPDPLVRTLMARIARDETRHASLAWQIHAWVRGRLTREEFARVMSAMHQAVTELTNGFADSSSAVAQVAGVPCANVFSALADVLNTRLWSKC